jgi:hypothetical protein
MKVKGLGAKELSSESGGCLDPPVPVETLAHIS